MTARNYRAHEVVKHLGWQQADRQMATQVKALRGARLDAHKSAMELAMALSPAMIKTTMQPYHHAAKRLRAGAGSHDHHAIIWTMVQIALGIEQRRNIINGLRAHFQAAEEALSAISTRATASGSWRACELQFSEIEAINEALDLHEIQLQVTSRRELNEIAVHLINKRTSAGDRVERISHEEAMKC